MFYKFAVSLKYNHLYYFHFLINACLIPARFHISQQTIAEYLNKKVLPPLKDKHGAQLLDEFVKRGENHSIMNKWHQKFFMYLVSVVAEYVLR